MKNKMAKKNISNKELREIIDRGKEIVTISGAQVVLAEEELGRIKEEEQYLRKTLSLLI